MSKFTEKQVRDIFIKNNSEYGQPHNFEYIELLTIELNETIDCPILKGKTLLERINMLAKENFKESNE